MYHQTTHSESLTIAHEVYAKHEVYEKGVYKKIDASARHHVMSDYVSAGAKGEYAIDSTLHTPKPRTTRKWQYLLSDSLTFSDKHSYGIRIQKPAKALVFDMCVKIVAHQQVETLYVEEHEFTPAELFNLTMLCKNKQVNLVNLRKSAHSTLANNVIIGPWTH